MAKLSVSRAWEETMALVRREGNLLFPVAFMFIALPGILFQFVLPAQGAQEVPQAGAWLLWLVPLGIVTIFGCLALSALSYFSGLSVGEALSRAGRRLLPVLGAVILVYVALLVGIIILTFLFSLLLAMVAGGAGVGGMTDPAALFGASPSAGLIAVIFILAIIAFSVMIGVRMSLLYTLGTVEPVSPIAMIRRSWAMTRGNFWRILAFFLVFTILIAVLSVVISSLIGILLSVTLGKPEPGTIGVSELILLIVSGLFNAAFSVFAVAMVTRIYAQLSGEAPAPSINGI